MTGVGRDEAGLEVRRKSVCSSKRVQRHESSCGWTGGLNLRRDQQE
jgi:hypothetical protein